jgi:hypothetical protein
MKQFFYASSITKKNSADGAKKFGPTFQNNRKNKKTSQSCLKEILFKKMSLFKKAGKN